MTPESILAAAKEDVAKAIKEDVGTGDVNAALIDPNSESTATLISREWGIFCGRPWVDEVVNQIGDFMVDWITGDGSEVKENQTIAEFKGRSRAILTAERIMLNFAQTLSGTATTTHVFAERLAPASTQILDTRKTIPGLRVAQKYAVRIGGGKNHRMGLFDAYLIKENHITAAGSLEAAINTARQQQPGMFLQVEVEDLKQLATCVKMKVPRVLIDNFTNDQIREAVSRFGDDIEIEASGNITYENVTNYAALGVDFVSVGALTKNVKALDLSLRFKTTKTNGVV